MTAEKEKATVRKDSRLVHTSSSFLLLLHPSFITSSNLFSFSSSVFKKSNGVTQEKKNTAFSRVQCNAMPFFPTLGLEPMTRNNPRSVH